MRKFSRIILSIIFALPMLFGTLFSTLITQFSDKNAPVFIEDTSEMGGQTLLENDDSSNYPPNSTNIKENTEDIVEFDDSVYDIENWEDKHAECFAGGTGTENDPYLISNAEELAYLSHVVNENILNTKNKYFSLTNDIVLNDGYFEENGTYHDGGDGVLNLWKPIGVYVGGDVWQSNHFKGSFEGKNYIISGLYINDDTLEYAGLFGFFTSSGYLRNIAIKNSHLNINSGGGIAGWIFEGNKEISNLKNYANIIGTTTVGGISKEIRGAQTVIKNCYNYGNVAGEHVGGISSYSAKVGFIDCVNYGDVSGIYSASGFGRAGGSFVSCKNFGTITVSDLSYSGGACGIMTNPSGSVQIINCENYGNVEGKIKVAGIAPNNLKGIVQYCKNFGDIQGETNVAGIITEGKASGQVLYCENYGKVSTTSDAAGGIITNSGGTIFKCRNYGEISNTRYEAGGIVGYAVDDTSISYCENYGKIISPVRPGGICGRIKNNTDSKINNCLNVGEVVCTGTTLYSLSSAFGQVSENIKINGVISTGNLNGEKNWTYYGSNFKAYGFSWKEEIISFSSTSCFQGNVTEEWLTYYKGFIKMA